MGRCARALTLVTWFIRLSWENAIFTARHGEARPRPYVTRYNSRYYDRPARHRWDKANRLFLLGCTKRLHYRTTCEMSGICVYMRYIHWKRALNSLEFRLKFRFGNFLFYQFLFSLPFINRSNVSRKLTLENSCLYRIVTCGIIATYWFFFFSLLIMKMVFNLIIVEFLCIWIFGNIKKYQRILFMTNWWIFKKIR